MAQLRNSNINSTGFIKLPSGNTAQRPSNPTDGQMRYNTTLGIVEQYDSAYTNWFPAGVITPIATGGTITNITIGSGNFRVHTFTSSGTFNITRAGEVQYLIVGGGGGGADTAGGGSGGVQHGSTLVTPQSYSIIVGAATANLGDNAAPGYDGNPSSALGVTASGGGGAGGGFTTGNGRTGGSGGGNGRNPAGSLFGNQGFGMPGQGHNGGMPTTAGDWKAGGGGGGGNPGSDAIDSTWAGNGGIGFASNISGSITFYAGGGGGGSDGTRGQGGLGGGGLGKLGGDATNYNGVANTGGGGGGGWSGICGAGGSGLVVVRYRTN